MSVEAALFVPGREMQEVSSAEDQAVNKLKARECAIKILGGRGVPVPSTNPVADQTAGPSSAEVTWWRTRNTDAKGPRGEVLDEDAHDDQGRDDSGAGEEELRIDPADGLLYCKSDFILEYGGTTEWDAAVAAEPYLLNPSELPKRNRGSESDCGVSEHEPQPEPEPATARLASFLLYASGSDSDGAESVGPEPAVVERIADRQAESANAASMALLTNMGFELDLARRALKIYPDSVEAATAWMLQGEADSRVDRSVDASAFEQTERNALTAGISTRDEERRIDQTDGNAYSQAEFVDEYGGLDEWNAGLDATPSKSTGSTRSDCTTTAHRETVQGTQVESLETYVHRGLKALRVDDDLCEYFGGMMIALALSLEEGSSVEDGFYEDVDNLVELLVDGYGCEEAAARGFVTNAPGLTPNPPSNPATSCHRNSKQWGTGAGVRRVHALAGASRMNVGVGVTDYVNPEEYHWA